MRQNADFTLFGHGAGVVLPSRHPSSRNPLSAGPIMASSTSLQHAVPLDERPRERLQRHGPSVLTDAELLAVLLRTGTAGCNAIELGRQLLARFNGLRGLFAASRDDLRTIDGLGEVKVGQLQAILELARREVAETLQREDVLTHPSAVKQYCSMALAHRQIECCLALYLDMRNRLIQVTTLSEGTLGQTMVYPREIVREALRVHAASVILTHNHPSGNPEPSPADERLTQHVKNALALVDIRLLDHIIVAGTVTTSLAERGAM
jgi:DNA repair protein RadC